MQLGKAKNQNVDLIKKAEGVKAALHELRNRVKLALKTAVPKLSLSAKDEDFRKKINAIRTLNNQITEKYKQVMAEIGQFCEEAIGKPPCEYAVVGLGSLARCEATPYSDFEHVGILSLVFGDFSFHCFEPSREHYTKLEYQ